MTTEEAICKLVAQIQATVPGAARILLWDGALCHYAAAVVARIKASFPFLILLFAEAGTEQAHRFAHTEERLRSGWCHLFGPHLDTVGSLEEAPELHSRDELFNPAVVGPDLPDEVEAAGVGGGRGYRGHASRVCILQLGCTAGPLLELQAPQWRCVEERLRSANVFQCREKAKTFQHA